MDDTSDLRDEIHTHIERINRQHHPQRRAPGRCSCWGPWPCQEAAVADALNRTLPHLEEPTS